MYGYCLKTCIPDEWIEERLDAVCDFWRKTKVMEWKDCKPSPHQINKQFKDRVNKAIDDFIEKNDTVFAMDDFYTQVTKERVSFYFKSAHVVWLLLNNNPDFFDQMWLPASAEVEDRLNHYADTHMQVRERLWFNQYDYKIDFKDAANYDDLDARVENLYLSQHLYSVMPYGRVLYLYGEDEYFLVKLALKDKIARVTTCIENHEAVAEPVKKCI